MRDEVMQGKKHREAGANLVEYSLLVIFIAMACIIAIRSLGSKVSSRFSDFSNRIP